MAERSCETREAGHTLNALTKKEKVLCVCFAIGCEREHTLEEIGQEFDVTRERPSEKVQTVHLTFK
ncbi:MAG TPA: sigma factor-like helix-turn-helix DNA-binding protein [Bryobacteraceae bacterium]|nr:sigma factor-like helix-turn-helix DNA-binding protein [Bryobacteraceae bacterium]